MPFDLHTVEVVDGSTLQNPDRLIVAAMYAVANVAGGSAGAAVTTAVAFASELPTAYGVQVTPSQACAVSVTSKTSTGFNVVLTPGAPAGTNATLAAGTFDVLVTA